MLQRKLLMSVLMSLLVVPASLALAADQERTQQQIQSQMQEQEQIYGSQLMTPQERAEHRVKMRAAKTEEEREQIRNEHHVRMKERAKEHGVVLPDEPPEHGMGRGMGPRGVGMGSGGGRNR